MCCDDGCASDAVDGDDADVALQVYIGGERTLGARWGKGVVQVPLL